MGQLAQIRAFGNMDLAQWTKPEPEPLGGGGHSTAGWFLWLHQFQHQNVMSQTPWWAVSLNTKTSCVHVHEWKDCASPFFSLWRFFNTNCAAYYFFICYQLINNIYEYTFINQSKTWSDAQQYCQKSYHDLAVIGNEINMVNAVQQQDFPVWTGLYRDGKVTPTRVSDCDDSVVLVLLEDVSNTVQHVDMSWNLVLC